MPKVGKWQEIAAYECCNPTTTTTTTAAPSTTTSTTTTIGFYAYSYVISATDIAAATGNVGNPTHNGKVYATTTNDETGNPATRVFSSPGSYIHWLCSLHGIVPTFGYYHNDVLVTTGLVSTQTNIGAC